MQNQNEKNMANFLQDFEYDNGTIGMLLEITLTDLIIKIHTFFLYNSFYIKKKSYI